MNGNVTAAAEVESEPATRPWFSLRRDGSTFEIFEASPDEAGREAHLTGKAAALLMARSNEPLAKPARIDQLDVMMRKGAVPRIPTAKASNPAGTS